MRHRIDEWGVRGSGQVALYDEPDRKRFVVELYVAGKPRRETFSYVGRSKSVAKAEARHCGAAAHTMRDERQGSVERPDSMKALYLKYVTANEAAWRPATLKGNAYRWRLWQAFVGGSRHPDDVTEDTMDEYVRALRKGGTVPNQIRAAVAIVRAVYRLGVHRKWVVATAPATYLLKLAKNEVAIEPPEYTPDEWRRMVAATDPTHPGQWRLHVVLLLQGSQGHRIASVRGLRWDDIDGEQVTWPAERMKQGVPKYQPITDTARAGLEVAQAWRAAEGYTGPWVLYAPGRRGGKGGRMEGATWGAEPVGYTTLHSALMQAERRAGVVHVKGRATHGTRKMCAGNVYAATHDVLAAAEWIGDKDAKQMKRYLKRHTERLEKGFAASNQATKIAGREGET